MSANLTPNYLKDRWPYASGTKTAGEAIYIPGEIPGTRKRVIDAKVQDGLPRVWLIYLSNAGAFTVEFTIEVGDDTGGASGQVVTVPVFEARQVQVAGAFVQVTAWNVFPGNSKATATCAIMALS